ncbi:MAG: MATE family efflux transporter [Ruminococcaceae bacterium]|nr:MATE family efflux transporter [Oscillospiraceae bacterium]
MQIQLSDSFTYKKLLKFTFPSIIMMIFTSIYGVVDGIFVSNFAGKTPFAAINLIMPVFLIIGAIGFMIGTGGSALVARYLGEGRREKANKTFSMLIYVSLFFGIFVSFLGFIFIKPVARLLGAEGEMLRYCVLYGRILLPPMFAFILQNEFQAFMIVAEKPQLGLWITVAAGVTNIVLDALFVAVFKWGLAGAAVATAMSQLIGGTIPLLYFVFSKKAPLRLCKASFDFRDLLKACTNGSSEMMTNISMSLVTILYNFQLMKFAGENGIAAYGVIMYVAFIFISIFIGYCVGSAPVISFHFGAQNHSELKKLLKMSTVIIGAFSIAMTIISVLLAKPLSEIFVGYDKNLLSMTVRGFIIYCFSFLLAGFNIFGSSFFTALNDGLVSAIISFLRTLLFQVLAVIVLPLLFGLDGIWFSIILAELLSFVAVIIFIKKMQPKYKY